MNTAKEACKKHHDGELKYYKTMAIYVKEQLDKKLEGSWHIIVGKLQHFARCFEEMFFSCEALFVLHLERP